MKETIAEVRAALEVATRHAEGFAIMGYADDAAWWEKKRQERSKQLAKLLA